MPADSELANRDRPPSVRAEHELLEWMRTAQTAARHVRARADRCHQAGPRSSHCPARSFPVTRKGSAYGPRETSTQPPIFSAERPPRRLASDRATARRYHDASHWDVRAALPTRV